jgi:lipopolysaccharide transport system ATP-binding protein
MSTLETTHRDEHADSITTPKNAAPLETHWLVKVESVRKKYCRDLRKSMWYALGDVFSALTLRANDTNQLREAEFWAVDDVSFIVNRGDSLGLLGRNGAGKSTLLKMIVGKRSLSAGTITTRGRIVALTELGLGFNLALSGRENAYVNAAVHGLTRKDFDKIIDEIIDFSGLRDFIDSAVQTYSTGMKARLGFSIATHLNPDILVVDEVLAVGDLEFRRKCVKHIIAYIRDGGSVILVAHDPYLIQSICNRCIVLDKGRLIFDGSGIDGVNFHFELGRSRQFTNLSEGQNAKQQGLQDRAAEAEAAELEDLAALPQPPRRAYAPLTPEQPIMVDEFEVLSVDGGPLVTGKPAKVLMHYRAIERASIMWGFTFCSSDLNTSIASMAKGLDGEPSVVEPGEGVLTAILPNFPLQPGVYGIRGGIGDTESLQAVSNKGYRDSPHFFTIVPSDVSRTANYKVLNGSLVNFDVEWKS